MIPQNIHVGHHIWRKSYGSPVVNIYAVEESSLRKVPMISVASETLQMLTGSSVRAINMDTFGLKPTDSALQYAFIHTTLLCLITKLNFLLRPSLFIGSHQGQIYALDSLVQEEDLKLEVYSTHACTFDQVIFLWSCSIILVSNHPMFRYWLALWKEMQLPSKLPPEKCHRLFLIPCKLSQMYLSKLGLFCTLFDDCLTYIQPIDIGHYCLPEDAEVRFSPTSNSIELAFLNFLKHGTWEGDSDFSVEKDQLHTRKQSNIG